MSNSLGQFQDIISRRLAGVQFSYYTAEEVRKLSVKEITNPIAFDSLNRPIRGGLYDPQMGVSPYDKLTRCETCGCEGLECPGHMAHIELLLPVYNPFLIDKLLKLLRSQCLNCYQFRMTKTKLRMYIKMFTLIKLGYVQEAKEYKSIQETLFNLQVIQQQQNSQQEEVKKDVRRKSSEYKTSDTELIQNTNNQKIVSIQEQKANKMFQNDIKSLEEKKAQILSLINVKNNPEQFLNGITYTTAMNNAFDETLKEFWSHINIGKCPHCKSQQSAVRKEGFSKFFVAKKGKNNDDQADDEEDNQKNPEMTEKNKNQKYLDPIQIKEIMLQFWAKEKKILSLIYGRIEVNQITLKNSKKGYKINKNDYNMFFIEVIPVPPNRFRPENKLGEQTFLHGHTVILTKIIQFNVELRQMIVLQNQKISEEKKQKLLQQLDTKFKNYLQLKQNSQFQQSLTHFVKINDIISKWLDIQDSVNIFYDSAKSTKAQDREGTGIRQLLEKKEGLFRMKMMGKRVNYAARSVISPDPNLNTNEVGVPLFVAKKLTFPEYVNEYNVKHLRKLIINGPFQHPGANFVVENGNKISLEALTEQQRIGLAKTLLNNSKNKVVYRHLQSGDVLLFNRQPTLHKPSLMSHIARVLPREQTIRMHYANCKSYNADFDGDEMNLHFLQSHLARAEAYNISLNDRQFINATNGVPIRELIQDSIVSAVYLTHKEKFFTREQFQLLLYSATWNMFQNNNVQGKPYKIFMVQPCILKPKQLWSGKQLISNIIKIVVQQNQTKEYEQGIFMEFKSKLSSEELSGIYKDDTQIIIKDNELLQGVLDKNSFGAGATYGLMHSFYELYGANLTGKLFTALAKLLSTHLQMHGFTCGMDDIMVKKSVDTLRLEEIHKAHKQGLNACAREFLDDKEFVQGEEWNLFNRPQFKLNEKKKKLKAEVDYLSINNPILNKIKQKLIREPQAAEAQDNIYKSSLSQNSSTILNITLGGLIKKFPYNNFSTMTNSGAKGSKVNHTQVSALLGQQELEGRRVPTMSTGRTLPCFVPYDPNPRAGGFISDRFLSGLRPAEFFFHCMAGREGLIDTAVKTSRSGYLQRCLMKHLESLKVAYDYTVRDCDNSVIQFYYGEDCIDTNKVKYLEKFRFLAENFTSFSQKLDPYNLKESHDFSSVQKFLSKRKKYPALYQNQTIMSNFLPGKYIGSISEKVNKSVREYIKKEQTQDDYNNIFSLKTKDINPSKFRILYNVKYLHSLIQPGDSVGCLAAQAIGEPSTQMTLNTFHLAGHGGVNLTLGIPRLREILMTATDKLKTPVMLLNFASEKISQDKDEAQKYARKLQKINLLELVNNIEVSEQKIVVVDDKILPPFERFRHYEIKIQLENLDAINFAFQINVEQISRRFLKLFLPNFLQYINKELKRDQKQELETRILKSSSSQAASSGIDTEALMTENEKNDYTSDGEKLNKYDDTETEYYNIFTENEEEGKNLNASQQNKKTQNKQQLQKSLSQQQQQNLKDKSDLFKASPYYNGHEIQGEIFTFKIKLPLDSKKLLMANLVEKILKKTLVYEIKNISNATLLKKDAKGSSNYSVQVQGVNFQQIWKMDHFDADTIDSNDIAAINQCYGIEAARNAIVKEIVTVFSVYGVVVDYRHLYLIADYLTFGGKLKAMNRTWMEENISPFLKMSFETCVKFLTNSAINNEIDNLNTPSSSIVLGRVPQVGTGVFDILYQF